ncbi:hypothetical protein X560_0782 [Listeria fleischmannii 1991]|uniref:Uncharacterized protein n=1 Tax=Listeria fleischmannii 1991 TaxID=1430899 RepID=A0A0J8GI52_9LIST|nr:hypothetical protein [Listeria fleischmannii]EMG27880.1 hypothetical protein LFLEISCH_08769 [Listeria fleischmannii subsp. fleischmannii LU2006-1]KMT60654.1 hypothetical protein X560_0782 [Listeria fleischmannii 1991]
MKKYISFLIITTLVFLTLTPFSAKAEEDEIYDGESLKLIQRDNRIILEDKSTGEIVTLEMDDESNGSLTLENGEIEDIHIDNEGNVYADGELEIEADVEQDDNATPTLLRASKWIYVQTYKYNTTTQGNLRSIALGICSFMPIVGPIYGIVGIIDAARSMGAKTLYVRVKQYRTSGYQFYKYDSYYYTDSKLTKLIKKTSKTKQMW